MGDERIWSSTLSNVKLKVDGKDVDPNSTGVNTDITKAQVITKDEKVDMIDVNLQTDLANKEERDKIRDAKDKVGDVVETVKNVTDDKNVGSFKENLGNNRFATRGANAVEDDEKLSKLLNELKSGNLSEDEAKNVILATVQKMYQANGFDDIPNIKFEEGISGGTDGARGSETGTIYLDINKIKDAMKDKENGGSGALIGLIAHETSHSIKVGEESGNKYVEEDFAHGKEDLAEKRFKETDETLSDTEKKDALAEIKSEVSKEREISDSLTVKSEDEELENNTNDAMIAAKRLELSGIKNPTSAQIEAEMKKLNQEKVAKFKFGTDEEVKKARELVSLLVDFTPVGLAKGLLESLRGKDTFTGEEIAGLQRILAILPYDKVADALKFGGKYLDNLASALTKDPKLATEVGEVATRNLGKADEVADTGKAVVNKVDGADNVATYDKLKNSLREEELTSLSKEYKWGNKNEIKRHFVDHGKDFNAKTEEEYLKKANDFYKNSGKYQVKIDEKGIKRVYDPATNTFGSYNADGTTKTFFKPAEKQKYFDKQ